MNTETAQFVENLFGTNALNRLPKQYAGRIFDMPIIDVAKGNEPIFGRFCS